MSTNRSPTVKKADKESQLGTRQCHSQSRRLRRRRDSKKQSSKKTTSKAVRDKSHRFGQYGRGGEQSSKHLCKGSMESEIVRLMKLVIYRRSAERGKMIIVGGTQKVER